MKLLNYGIWIFPAVLFSALSYAQGIANDSMGSDSSRSVAPAADSARVQDSESGAMYRSAISSMRRDVPRTESRRPDTSPLPQRIRIPDTLATTSSSKTTDSLHVSRIPTSDTASAEPRIKLSKKAIIVAAGSCGLIGCGIVAYLLKNSKKDDVVSRPAGIPPPPDPPQ